MLQEGRPAPTSSARDATATTAKSPSGPATVADELAVPDSLRNRIGAGSELGRAEMGLIRAEGSSPSGAGGAGGRELASTSQQPRDSISRLEAAKLGAESANCSAIAVGEPVAIASSGPAARRALKRRPFFNPSDAFCHWWSAVVSLAFLYNFWSLSYRFAFREIDDSTVTIWFMFDYTADIIYLNDILVNFRTGYLEDGVLQRDPKKIGIHYRESTLFYLDMLCLLPFDFLYLSFSYCSILRCNKLVKIYKFWAFVDRTERHTNYPNVFRTFTLVHYIFVIFHWNACLFHMISKHNVIDIATLYKINDTQCDDILCQYLHAFYWSTLALTLIGDLPRPRTRGEFIYVIVELCFGLFLFASVLGHVANIVTNVSAARKEFQAKLDAVKTFMRTRRVSDELQNKVIRWFDYLWYSQKSSDEERSVACLPDRLKAEIAIHVNLDTLKRVDIFQNTEAGFLCELVLRLKPVLFSPGDYVCRKNEVGHEMYIVSRGVLEVVKDDGQTVVATFRAGSYFGEIAVLNVGSAGNKRTASVRSVGYSDLFCLSKSDLWDVLRDYPHAEARIRTVAEERLSKLSAGGAALNGNNGDRKRRGRNNGNNGAVDKRASLATTTQSASNYSGPTLMRSPRGAPNHSSSLAPGLAPLSPTGALVSPRRRLCNSASCYYKSLQQAAALGAGPYCDLMHHYASAAPAYAGHLAPDAYATAAANAACCPCAYGANHADHRQPDIWVAPATPRLSSSSGHPSAAAKESGPEVLRGGRRRQLAQSQRQRQLQTEPDSPLCQLLSRHSTSASNFQSYAHDNESDTFEGDDFDESHQLAREANRSSLANSRSLIYAAETSRGNRMELQQQRRQQQQQQPPPMQRRRPLQQRPQGPHGGRLATAPAARLSGTRGRPRDVAAGGQSHGASSGGASASSLGSSLSFTGDGGTSRSTNRSAPAGRLAVGTPAGQQDQSASQARRGRLQLRRSSSLSRAGASGAELGPAEPLQRDQRPPGEGLEPGSDLLESFVQAGARQRGRPASLASIDSLDFEPIEPREGRRRNVEEGGGRRANECRIDMDEA